MPQEVSLQVMRHSDDGFRQTSTQQGNHYYYQFTGGNMGNGDVVIRNGSPQTIEVTLVNSVRFEIIGASTTGDNQDHIQISWNVNSPNEIVFTDQAHLAEEGVEIFIQIRDLSNLKEFVCDPRVSNED